MKMYLNSQYHMDPPRSRSHRTVLWDNSTHAVWMRPQVRVRVTPRRSPGCADSGRALRRRSVTGGGPLGGGAPRARRRRPALSRSSTIARIDRQQRDAVLGDDGQQRVLLTGDQRGQRTHRAPHLLALAGPVAAGGRSPRPRAPRGRAGPGWPAPAAAARALRRVSPAAAPPSSGHSAGHTSGFGRNRTVSSLPRSCASITMHRRRTDASRTRRRMPPTPMIKSSSTRPKRQRRRSRPAATLAAAGRPHRSPDPGLPVDDRSQRPRRR